MGGWCGHGGIRWLLDLIEEHRGPLEYDWRTRFGLPLHEVGRAMSWGEAYRLVGELADEPSSHTAAAMAGWQHPWPREAALLADMWDLTATAHSGKRAPTPYPRPWRRAPRGERHVPDVAGRSREDVRAILEQMSGRRLADV